MYNRIHRVLTCYLLVCSTYVLLCTWSLQSCPKYTHYVMSIAHLSQGFLFLPLKGFVLAFIEAARIFCLSKLYRFNIWSFPNFLDPWIHNEISSETTKIIIISAERTSDTDVSRAKVARKPVILSAIFRSVKLKLYLRLFFIKK